MGNHVPDLWAMKGRELLQFAIRYITACPTLAAELFPARPPGYGRHARTLGEIALAIHRSRQRARRDDPIASKLYEAKARSLWQRLPDWARPKEAE